MLEYLLLVRENQTVTQKKNHWKKGGLDMDQK